MSIKPFIINSVSKNIILLKNKKKLSTSLGVHRGKYECEILRHSDVRRVENTDRQELGERKKGWKDTKMGRSARKRERLNGRVDDTRKRGKGVAPPTPEL